MLCVMILSADFLIKNGENIMESWNIRIGIFDRGFTKIIIKIEYAMCAAFFYQKPLSQKVLLFLYFKRSAKAAAFAEIWNVHDSH